MLPAMAATYLFSQHTLRHACRFRHDDRLPLDAAIARR